MDSFFSEIGISALDFTQISAGFFLTMLVFFGLKTRKHVWLNYLTLTTFVIQCLLIIRFRDGLPVKLFATLMLMTTFIVEAVVNRRRKLESAEQSATR